MRKTVLLLASVALAMVVAGGVAWAATIQCPTGGTWGNGAYRLCQGTAEDDTLYGTRYSDYITDGLGSDKLFGYRGNDRLYVNARPDELQPDTTSDYAYGGRGPDRITAGEVFQQEVAADFLYGGRGNDTIIAAQRQLSTGSLGVTKQIVDCGAGNDAASFDVGADVVKANCERKIAYKP
jgi:Ca2+-binding RTX toxin-like protein